MKYLRKIFESTKEDQVEDIESIFTEYLDQKYTADDGEEYSDCYIETKDSNQFVSITISSYLESPAITDLKDFDKIFKERSEYLELLKKIRTSLSRLDGMGYSWTMDFNDEGFHIKAFYKDTIITLADCFGGEEYMRGVDEAILKRYMKDHYNLNYSSYIYKESTQGYYGKRAYLVIYFNNPVPTKLIEDLKKLTRSYEVYSTSSGKEMKSEKAFYNVELINGTNGLKLELQ